MNTKTSRSWAFLFPGQGAQYPGMGKDFYDHFALAKETFEEADERLGESFSRLIFEGPASELTLTKNSQLAIYICSMAILRTLQQQFPSLTPSVCAGLSLGEYSALTAAAKLSFAPCLSLVKARAHWMHEACEKYPGTMHVVLGLEADTVEQLLFPLKGKVWAANFNCPGQVVIAGTLEGVAQAAELLKQNGAKRVLPLEVAGAFHSGLMQQAQDKLAEKIREAPLSESSTALVMNVPGDYVDSLEKMRHYLIQQVTQPVRWEKGIRAMEKQGIQGYLEIGCGKTLSGMNKKIGVTASTYSIERIEDLEEIATIGETM